VCGCQPSEVHEAVKLYFGHYLINPGAARLPFLRFTDLLVLRMFCEATMPHTAHNMSSSAVSMFVVMFDAGQPRADCS